MFAMHEDGRQLPKSTPIRKSAGWLLRPQIRYCKNHCVFPISIVPHTQPQPMMNSNYFGKFLIRRPVSPRYSSFSTFYGGVPPFASQGGALQQQQQLRSYPQYTVYGEHCFLGLKLLPPSFRLLKSNTLVVDSNKKGRILFEWTPRSSDGSVDRDRVFRFGLSPEEIGLLIDQLPNHQVEFSRLPPPSDRYNSSSSAPPSQRGPEKVMRITPMNAGVVSFKVGFESADGSNSDMFGSHNHTGVSTHVDSTSMEVLVQLGEFQVMREIMRSSIPLLVGWKTMVEVAMQRNLEDVLRDQGNHALSGLSSHDVPF